MPAFVGVKLNDWPWLKSLDWIVPSSDVTLWGAESLLVHVTFWPFLTVTDVGLNANPAALIVTPPELGRAGARRAGGRGRAVLVLLDELLLEPQPAMAAQARRETIGRVRMSSQTRVAADPSRTAMRSGWWSESSPRSGRSARAVGCRPRTSTWSTE